MAIGLTVSLIDRGQWSAGLGHNEIYCKSLKYTSELYIQRFVLSE